MQAVTGIIAIALIVGVYMDAKRIGVRPNLLPGMLKWGPTGWAVWSLFLNVLAIPLYAFYARPRYIAAIHATAQGGTRPLPWRRFPLIAAVGCLLILLLTRAGGSTAGGDRVRALPVEEAPSVLSTADACLATCRRLGKEEPRSDRERKLDEVLSNAYNACANRESGGSTEPTALARAMKACGDAHAGVQECVAACAGIVAQTTAVPARGETGPSIRYPANWPRGTANMVFNECAQRAVREVPNVTKTEIITVCNCILRETANLFPAAYAEANPARVVGGNATAYAMCSQ